MSSCGRRGRCWNRPRHSSRACTCAPCASTCRPSPKAASAVEWWNGSMATRLNDLSSGHKVVIMQRLHEADLTGDLLAKGGYDLLCLPAEFEPEHRCATSIGWSDPRQESGELLW